MQCRQRLQQSKGLRAGFVHQEWGRSNQGTSTWMGAGSTAFYQPHGTRLPPTHYGELNHASMCDDHRDEGKTHCKNSQWDGWDMRQFFSQDLAGRGNGTVLSLPQDCFSLLLSQHCKLQIHALLRYSERSSTNSSSALQFSSFSRFVRIEHYFVSKLLRVLRTSKVREIILNMVSVRANENSEKQTNHWPVVSSTV